MDDQPPEVTEAVEFSDLREGSAAASSNMLNIQRLLLTPRQRMRRLTVGGGSVLLALLLLLAAVPGLRAGAGSWLAGFISTPSATLPAGTDRFFFIASVPDIQLSIDGRSVGPLPRIGADPPLVLARGQHRISWNAEPFLPQSCILSVPFGLHDTCGAIPVPVATPRGSVTTSMVLLRESLAALSPSQQSAVVATLQSALPNYASAIAPGDHYALAQFATQPLRGTMVFQLDTTYASGTGDACMLTSQPPYIVCNFDSSLCAVCTVPVPLLLSAGVTGTSSSWYVITYATLSYTIRTLSGRALIANGPISQGGLAVEDFTLLVAFTWSGVAWHAQPFLGPAYDALLQRLTASAAFLSTQPVFGSPYFVDLGCAAMSDFIGSNAAFNTYRSVSFISGPNPADGCLAIVTVDTASGTQKADYLYRFGGLVAINDLAHRLDTFWPMASAHERQIAAALLSSGTPAP